MENFSSYPVLPVRNTVIFPGITVPLVVGRPRSLTAVQKSSSVENQVIILAQHQLSSGDPSKDDLYRVGTLAHIEHINGTVEREFNILIRGISRFRVQDIISGSEYLSATGEIWPDQMDGDPLEIARKSENLKTLAIEVIDLLPGEVHAAKDLIRKIEDPILITHFCSSTLDISVDKKQELLEDTSVRQRLEILLTSFQSQKDSLLLQKEIGEKVAQKLGKEQREVLLREQLKTIREQLGDEENLILKDLREKIEKSGMPEEPLKVAYEELARLENMNSASPETHIIRTYLDWLTNMPWINAEVKPIDLDAAQKILDDDHYGIEQVKKRIIEYLAVMKLKQDLKGPILCFVGPPGVGKTSLGHSIAKALSRAFVRASLGGVRDEAEIRGHRRTYIGAMPGRIVQGIKRAGASNPVFMLDEIDKLTQSFQGDPASALLEVLDPEQNKNFMDHYLDVNFDLSNVFFIVTANSLDTIPRPLLDRMEIVEINGYTTIEKLNIAKKFLLPRQLKEHGLNPEQIQIIDEIFLKLIIHYTREAGIRELQRSIAALCRSVAEKLVRNVKVPILIDSAYVDQTLGPEKFIPEVSERIPLPGVVTGLAWTPLGGEILFVEATSMPGKGQVILTGQLGDVMKESAQIAVSLIRSNLTAMGVSFDFEKRDIHIHVPAGAIPKDGPSAGTAILCAIASLVVGKNVNPKIAMTGEVTLRGVVLAVGGIKEKVIAAHRAGIEQIILPQRNQKDLRDVPVEVSQEVQFHFVNTMVELLAFVLGITIDKALDQPAAA